MESIYSKTLEQLEIEMLQLNQKKYRATQIFTWLYQKKVDSFDEEEFLVETVMGYLVLKGEGLDLIKLDTLQGTVSIKGLIKSFDYIDDVKKDKEHSLFNRLFK